MEYVEYISCSAYEMDDILYDCFPDNIVAAKVSDDNLVYFVDADTNEMIYIEKVKRLLEDWLRRQLHKTITIRDISYDPSEDFILIIHRESL